jgi:hypothetical protein
VIRLSALILSVVLVSSACGGSDANSEIGAVTTSTVDSAVDGSSDDLAALEAGLGSSPFSFAVLDSEGACIGSNVVDELGEDRLAELGVNAANALGFDPVLLPDMTDAERDLLVDVTDGCVDLRTMTADTYGDGDAVITACAYEAISRDDARQIVRAAMNANQEAGADAMFDIFGKADACVSGEEPAPTGDDSHALAGAFAASNDDGTSTEAENQCFGDNIVATIGFDRFTELGVTASNVDEFSVNNSGLTSEELDSYTNVFAGCFDLRQFLLDWFVEGFADPDCVAETLTEDDAWRFVRSFIAPSDDPGSETPPDVQAKFDACPV